MFIEPAYAQAAGGGEAMFLQFLPLVAIVAIMYFLVIRPQQQRAKAHQALVAGLRRGDVVVTSGGVIGKVTKVVDDNEVLVEVADGVRMRIVRQMIQEVRSKSEPAKDDDAKSN
jgi:preprotein translocase subunit YajC